MARTPPRNPLVAIVGATGTGKSELAVEIARQHNGEIINGDAMQLYAGLPIITNKISVEEQKGIPHHLLGCIGLEEQTWVVGTFVRRALKTIEEIRSRGRLPILVGGTHYYTQSLLFHDRLAEQEDGGQQQQQQEEEDNSFVANTADKWPILQASTDTLWAELHKVDPIMADRWHPNDRRKIQRSLEIFLQTGRRASDIYAEQRQRSEANAATTNTTSPTEASPEQLRFPTLLFWVHSDADALRQRLDARVDRMLANGLLDEVRALHAARTAAAASQPIDESRGIWVSIGYKEFVPYVAAAEAAAAAPATTEAKANAAPDAPTPAMLETLHRAARERTQIATRQYAKRQERWLRRKLAPAVAAAGTHARERCFVLDASDAANFAAEVVAPATELTRCFLAGEPRLPAPGELSPAAAAVLAGVAAEVDGRAGAGQKLGGKEEEEEQQQQQQRFARRECGVCGTTCVTAEQWAAHVRSKAHRKLVAKKSRRDAEVEGKKEEEEEEERERGVEEGQKSVTT